MAVPVPVVTAGGLMVLEVLDLLVLVVYTAMLAAVESIAAALICRRVEHAAVRIQIFARTFTFI